MRDGMGTDLSALSANNPRSSLPYCTVSVTGVLTEYAPEVTCTVIVYVPAGVRGTGLFVGPGLTPPPPPPPQATPQSNNAIARSAAKPLRRETFIAPANSGASRKT